MAVTNYFTVDGLIQGEETGGTFTGYVPDALGSVTATVSSAGAVQNTYRYKPYGEQLAKTGGAADPRFGWRQSEQIAASSSLRASSRGRHQVFSTTNGADIAHQTIIAKNPYAMGIADDILCNLTNVSCYPIRYGMETGPTKLYCGAYEKWVIKWDIEELRRRFIMGDGVIIQYVYGEEGPNEKCVSREHCGKKDTENPYYEAWFVRGDSVFLPGATQFDPPKKIVYGEDIWTRIIFCDCHEGWFKTKADVLFCEIPERCPYQWGWKRRGSDQDWGDLLGNFDAPPGWWSKKNLANKRCVNRQFDCCDPVCLESGVLADSCISRLSSLTKGQGLMCS